MSTDALFQVGFSADFLDENRRLIFPDVGLGLLENQPGLEYNFIANYYPEYAPEQDCELRRSDLASNRASPRTRYRGSTGYARSAAVALVMTTSISMPARNVTLRTRHYITPQGVIRPIAESIVLFVLALSHNLVRKDRLVREGKWVESTRMLGN